MQQAILKENPKTDFTNALYLTEFIHLHYRQLACFNKKICNIISWKSVKKYKMV